MTVERTLKEGLASLLAIVSSLLFGCGGGGGHGTMMAQNPDAAADASVDTTDDGEGGGDGVPVNVNVTIDSCPTVVASASPSMAPVGQPISVGASGLDLDGDALTYRWTAAVGTFAMPSAAATTFTCSQAGNVQLVVTVSDRQCDAQAAIPIVCRAAP